MILVIQVKLHAIIMQFFG